MEYQSHYVTIAGRGHRAGSAQLCGLKSGFGRLGRRTYQVGLHCGLPGTLRGAPAVGEVTAESRLAVRPDRNELEPPGCRRGRSLPTAGASRRRVSCSRRAATVGEREHPAAAGDPARQYRNPSVGSCGPVISPGAPDQRPIGGRDMRPAPLLAAPVPPAARRDRPRNRGCEQLQRVAVMTVPGEVHTIWLCGLPKVRSALPVVSLVLAREELSPVWGCGSGWGGRHG